MKSLLSFTLIAVLCCAFFSCQKEKNSAHIQGDYVIAGMAGSYSLPNKKDKFFLVNNGQLWLDYNHTDQTIPGSVDGFIFNARQSQASYDKAASLLTSIPQELLAMQDATLGNIIADAGYTDVRASINGTMHHWIFQGDLSNTAPAIQQYAENIYNNLPW